MIPWAVITAILGDYPMALKLFGLYIFITIVRNIIEPKIVGSQIGLHPVVTWSACLRASSCLAWWDCSDSPSGFRF